MATPTINLGLANKVSPTVLQGGSFARWLPQDLVSGFDDPKWQFVGLNPLNQAYQDWRKGLEDPIMSGASDKNRPNIEGPLELTFGNGDEQLHRTGTFMVDPATGQLTQQGDWKYKSIADDTGKMFGQFALGATALLGGASLAGLGEAGAAGGAAGGSLGYVPANAAATVGGAGSAAATPGFQLGQLAAGLGAPAAGDTAALAGVMGGTAGSGAGAGFSGAVGGLAPVVDAVGIPGLGANLADKSLGAALLDLGGAGLSALSPKDWLQLVSSGYNWMQADKLSDRAGGVDPFGAYRSTYARQLADLMANPSGVTKLPGYEAAMKASEQALTRNLAAQGLTGSGTAAEALANFGGQFQNQFYQQQIAQLAGLSGANFNNAPTALQADIASWNAQNQIINNLVKILPHLGLG